MAGRELFNKFPRNNVNKMRRDDDDDFVYVFTLAQKTCERIGFQAV